MSTVKKEKKRPTVQKFGNITYQKLTEPYFYQTIHSNERWPLNYSQELAKVSQGIAKVMQAYLFFFSCGSFKGHNKF